MKNNAYGMILGSFVGDSLALGVHWIYETNIIKQKFGRVDTFLKPLPDSYHPSKDKGGFTHYGDQEMVLLESTSAKKKFDLEDFSWRWRSLFKDYKGYMDQATRGTLANYAAGKKASDAGSMSNELSGAIRIAPLAALYSQDLAGLVAAARAQTAMTHRDPLTVDCSEFFARLLFHILKGARPSDAMEKTAAERFTGLPIESWFSAGRDSIGEDSISEISRFGQSCHTPDAFPGIVHLVCKYEKDLREALIQAVMAGGDNATRAMAVGMILGAHLGMEAIPEEWVSGLTKKSRIMELAESII